jgi:uncharacterized protein (TIGR02246 family)
MTESPDEVGQRVLKELEDAWNAGDGQRFAEPFTEDAEFVNIRGEHASGRTAIAMGHQAIFDSIYKDSVNKYEAILTKQLADDVLYVLGRATLNAPTGPMAGEHRSHFSVILVRADEGDWQVALFHNTLMAPPAGPRPE